MIPWALNLVARKRKLTGSLGDRVKFLLDEQGQSVKWLAERIGLHRTSTSRIVYGKATDPPLSTLRRIAAALGVTVGDLVDNGDPPEK